MRQLVRRPAAAGLVSLLLCLGATACGGGDGNAAPTPVEPSQTQSSEPTEPPEPEETEEPLSRFEDQAQVKAARGFAVAVAKAINDRDADLSSMARLITAHGRDVLPGVIEEDLGYYYPGPLPFTPVHIVRDGDAVRVESCLWTAGWAQDRKTKLPAARREVLPAAFVFKRSAGTWRVDDLVDSTANCNNIKVKGVAW